MKITATLSRYLARLYFLNTLFLVSALLMVVYLFDTVELIRRASKHDDISAWLVMQMGLLKLPEVGQILLPFAILFSAMFTFWQLTKRSELIVVRASGFSVWQFLSPVLAVAFLFGVIQMSIVNPIGSLLVSKYEQLENEFLERRDSEIALFKEGLWLRQNAEDDEHISDDGYIILHAARIQQPDWTMKKVSIFFFEKDDKFVKRIEAKTANLLPGRWILHNAEIFEKQQDSIDVRSYELPTNLTISDIEESFSSPETMSFWRLPSHIQTLEDTGFDAARLRVHYHNLLSQPLMFAAMVLLAATVSMRPPRFRGAATLFGIGIFMGFIVFFASSFLQALGSSGQMPVILAAWSPALISFLLGLSVVMNLEDG